VAFVLIFDGNETHALRASDALSAAGHACGWVSDTEQAARVLHRRAPDLILLDQAVPGADGGTLPEWLRQTAGADDLPIILLTSGSFVACIGAEIGGVIDEIRKPFDPSFLVWRINHALESHRRNRLSLDHGLLFAARASSEPRLRSIA